LLGKPIEPVADGFLNNAVSFSECIDLIALLSANCSKNALCRNVPLCLLKLVLKFLQTDIFETVHFLELELQR
jgi:hypothetical protein